MRNIIFDLGQVLYLLDEKRFVRCFQESGIYDIEKFYQPNYASILYNYEKGFIDTKKFFAFFKQLVKVDIDFAVFHNCWNSLLCGFIADNLYFLRRLSSKYKIFIMSNINAMHYDYIQQEPLFEELMRYKVYFSHIEGLRKPQEAFYLKILNENHLIPSETLFIDDNYQNVAAARNLGIKGLFLKNPFLLIKKLRNYII